MHTYLITDAHYIIDCITVTTILCVRIAGSTQTLLETLIQVQQQGWRAAAGNYKKQKNMIIAGGK